MDQESKLFFLMKSALSDLYYLAVVCSGRLKMQEISTARHSNTVKISYYNFSIVEARM